MTRLKIGIQRIEKIVFGKVLEQDDSLRLQGILARGGEICIKISSLSRPQLSSDTLFIRGDHGAEDAEWFAYSYSSTEAAAQAVKDIRALVLKVNDGPMSPSQEHCGLEIIE